MVEVRRSSPCLPLPQDRIPDRWAWGEARASLLLRLERRGEAVQAYRSLLALNPDHYRMHEGLQAAMGLKVWGDGVDDEV